MIQDIASKIYHTPFTHSDKQNLILAFLGPPASGKSYFIYNTCLPKFISKGNKDALIIVFSPSINSQQNQQYIDTLSKYKNVSIYDDIPDPNQLKQCGGLLGFILAHAQQNNDKIDDMVMYLAKNGPIKKENDEVKIQYDQVTNQPKFIVIFDDLDMDQMKQIYPILRVHRHSNITVFFGSHNVKDLPLKVRTLTDVFCMKNINMKHLKNYHESYVQNKCPWEQFEMIYEKIMQQKYSFMCIQPQNSNNQISINISKKIM